MQSESPANMKTVTKGRRINMINCLPVPGGAVGRTQQIPQHAKESVRNKHAHSKPREIQSGKVRQNTKRKKVKFLWSI